MSFSLFDWRRVIASPKQLIARVSCFCFPSIALSRLKTISDTAAFISAFIKGGSINLQLSGVKYLSENSLRNSFDNPLVAQCSNLIARSFCMSLPYFLTAVGSMPRISKNSGSTDSSVSGTGGSVAIGGSTVNGGSGLFALATAGRLAIGAVLGNVGKTLVTTTSAIGCGVLFDVPVAPDDEASSAFVGDGDRDRSSGVWSSESDPSASSPERAHMSRMSVAEIETRSAVGAVVK